MNSRADQQSVDQSNPSQPVVRGKGPYLDISENREFVGQRKSLNTIKNSDFSGSLNHWQSVANQSQHVSGIAQLQKLAHESTSLNVEVAQMARLGTGGFWSAKKYINWYFSGGDPKMRKGEALREIYTQIGIDNDSDEDRRTKSKLKQDNVIDDQDIDDLEKMVVAYIGGGKAALPPERKNLSSETWKHIWRGDFNASKKKATGYHWTGRGDDSWLERNGTTGRSQSNFYEEQVQVRDEKVDAIKAATGVEKNKIRGKVKDDMSTFFPNNWSENEVKDAIETSDSQGKITSKDADGITLVKSGTTIYPSID